MFCILPRFAAFSSNTNFEISSHAMKLNLPWSWNTVIIISNMRPRVCGDSYFLTNPKLQQTDEPSTRSSKGGNTKTPNQVHHVYKFVFIFFLVILLFMYRAHSFDSKPIYGQWHPWSAPGMSSCTWFKLHSVQNVLKCNNSKKRSLCRIFLGQHPCFACSALFHYSFHNLFRDVLCIIVLISVLKSWRT